MNPVKLSLSVMTAAAALLAGSATGGRAAEAIKPAIVYDLGGKFDKSFNEGVFHGAEAFKARTGIVFGEFAPTNDAQIEQGLRNFARKGFSPILGVGFDQAEPIKKVAAEFPKIKFAIIDGDVNAPNVQAISFKEYEGSFLAGALAALTTKTDKIGFVGGMDIPLIRKFSCGYAQGAAAINPKIGVTINMTGTTGAAWNDPVKGGELAKSQIESGVDIIYQAAGATGIGVLQTVADAGKLGIGVDSNQNGLHPGHMLTSVMKGVGVATDKTFTEALNGTWQPGNTVLGLKEQAVSLAFDDENAPLISADIKARIDALQADIIAGKVAVHNYAEDNHCPL
ncbi:MAG: BMP family ABC transporter substrate-binding protein [Azospirillaceae bacterium]|nr:BMP family ABC transporter substrate-binding protein [Azospirillaceae bacterium]